MADEIQLDAIEQPIAEGESAPQTEAAPPESEAQVDDKPKPELTATQKRMNQLSWQRHEAERRANAAAARAEQAEQRAQQLEAERQELYRRASTPKFEQFNDLTQYERAMEQHNQQAIAQQQRAFQEQANARQQELAQQEFAKRRSAYIAQGAEKYPDFVDVVGNPAIPQVADIHPAVLEAVMEDPAIAYYLGKNPAVVHRMMTYTPAKAILEVGRIAEQLARTPSRQTSNAPAPPTTVGGNNAAAKKSLSDMSQAEYEAERRKQRRR
jgi:hypothetical protein